ncbi:MAG TPA: MFS transporter [Candidatus Diapherotrites archaeon]|nr:MFS transporter [Candidatus Diapherotrites archaeon]
MEFKQTANQQKKDLKYYLTDGIFWAGMYYLGLVFLVPYLISLKASTFQIGLLNVLPIFIASFFGLLSYDLVKYFKSQKHFVVFFIALQAFFWIPLALVGFIIKSKVVVWLVIIFYCLITIMEQLPYPVYREWIGKLFDTSKIVRYTSRKQLIQSLFSILPLFLAGVVMDAISKNNAAYGFSIIFIVAGLFRFGSVVVMSKMSETENQEHLTKKSQEMSKPVFKVFNNLVLKNKQFLYFITIVSLIYFSMYIAAPYYRYYFLNILLFDYKQYIILEIGSILGLVLSFYYWGKICDKFGATKVLKAIILFLPVYPLFVILFGNNVLLLFLLNLFDGVLMAGLTLSIYGYFYQNVKYDMINHMSFFMIFQSTAMLLGSIIGGIISTTPKFWYMGLEAYGLLLIFGISILFRLFTIGFVNKIEDKNKDEINIPKNILLQRPIIFGVTQFLNFTKAEGEVILLEMYREVKDLKKGLKKEEKTINKKIDELTDKEKELFKSINSQKTEKSQETKKKRKTR